MGAEIQGAVAACNGTYEPSYTSIGKPINRRAQTFAIVHSEREEDRMPRQLSIGRRDVRATYARVSVHRCEAEFANIRPAQLHWLCALSP